MFLSQLCRQARRRTEEAVAELAETLAHCARAARESCDAYRPVPLAAVRMLAVLEAHEAQAFGAALMAETPEQGAACLDTAHALRRAMEAARWVL